MFSYASGWPGGLDAEEKKIYKEHICEVAIQEERVSRERKYGTTIVICQGCNKEFKTWASYNRKFCSRACRFGESKKANLTCLSCGKFFVAYCSLNRQYCSQVCSYADHRKALIESCRKFNVDYETLSALYVAKELSTVKIGRMFGVDHSVVSYHLKKFGIPARPFRRKTGRKTCLVLECREPVKQRWHAVYKKYYGTLCENHERLKRAQLNRDYRRRINNIPPEKWKPTRIKK